MNEKAEMINRIQYLINGSTKKKSQILRELHLSTSTLSDWEKGKGNPSSTAIIKLARYFDVSTDFLLMGKKEDSNGELPPAEKEWLTLYYELTEPQRRDLSGLIRSPSDAEDAVVWLKCLKQLSAQEREVCMAFVRGVLAEKNLRES